MQMEANERGEAAGGIVASATVLIVSLVTAVATSGGTLAFLAGIPRQLRAIAARIVKSVEQAGSKLKPGSGFAPNRFEGRLSVEN